MPQSFWSGKADLPIAVSQETCRWFGEILNPRVEDDKENNMNSTATLSTAVSADRSKAVPLVFAGLLGLFIVGFVGFVQIDAVHNAGHDYRHSMAFPCH